MSDSLNHALTVLRIFTTAPSTPSSPWNMAHSQYEPIWHTKSLEEFKKVFTDIVRAHHQVYNHFQGREILQMRGLREENLVLCRTLKSNASDSSDSKLAEGVFHDWDLFSTTDPLHYHSSSTPETDSLTAHGVQAFLPLDMSGYSSSEKHLYRHHLESFLFLLFWAGLHYPLDGNSDDNGTVRLKPKVHPDVVEWNPTRRTCGSWKEALFRYGWGLDSFKSSEMRNWSKPLFDLFSRGLKSRYGYYRRNSGTQDHSGLLTFERFMMVLGYNEELAAWDDLPFAEPEEASNR